MRSTLLAAQKMAKEIVEEAEAKKAQIMEETEAIARERAGKLAEQVAQEEARLRSAKASVAAMVANIQELLNREQEFLASLPDYDAAGEEEKPSEDVADEVAAEIGDSISRMMSEESAPAPEEAPAAPVAEDPVDEAPTRRMDLSELRFGRNYEIQ